MKKILSVLTNLFLGFFLGLFVFFFFISILGLPMYFNLPPLLLSNKEPWMYTAMSLLFIITLCLCIWLVYRIRKTRNVFSDILKPSKEKALLNAAVLTLLFIPNILLSHGRFVVYNAGMQTLTNEPVDLFIGIILNYLYYYPFSAAIYSLFILIRKKKQTKKHSILYPLLLAVLFNPLSFANGGVFFSGYVASHTHKVNCGINIVEVNKDEPADRAGLQRLDVITAVNDVPVKTPDDLRDIVTKAQDKKVLRIKTRIGVYSATAKKDSNTGRYLLGITSAQALCVK